MARNNLLLLSYVTIPALWGASQFIVIPYYIHIVTLVTAILYAACHFSLKLREVQHDTSAQLETMNKEDAMQFPLVGSVGLFGLYLAFKYLDKEWVNFILALYFCILGCFAVTATLNPLFATLIPQSMNFKYKKAIKIDHKLPKFIGGDSPWDLSIDVDTATIVAFIVSATFTYFYNQTRYWAFNNVLGISFCVQGISQFSLGNYKIGAILLIGLFFYDIFWVFGTDVMVTVAKNVDGPIKLLFPKSLAIDEVTGKYKDLSLLGLGDIVLPGFFLALLLRFDAQNANVAHTPTNVHTNFPKPYFNYCLIAYILGLITTLVVMIQFNHAQPALLYLVPACVGSSFITAVVKGQVKQLFDYTEEDELVDEKKEEAKIKKEE